VAETARLLLERQVGGTGERPLELDVLCGLVVDEGADRGDCPVPTVQARQYLVVADPAVDAVVLPWCSPGQ
jgi:hypothetical protein